VRIQDQGEIRSIDLPDGWVEVSQNSEPLASWVVRTFRAPDTTDVLVRLIRRFRRLPPSVVATLRSHLERPGRVLTLSEIDALVPLIGNLADPASFTISSVQARDLHGRRGIWVEGAYRGQPLSAAVLYIASGDAGDSIEELWWIASHEQLARYATVFPAVVQSIRWSDSPPEAMERESPEEEEDDEQPDEDCAAEAATCLARGDVAGALAAYERAIDVDDQAWPAYAGRARVYKETGDLAQAIQDYDQAVALLNRALVVMPHDGTRNLSSLPSPQAIASVLAERGLVRFLRGELEPAFADLNAALRLDPRHGPAYCNRGMVYLRKDNDVPRALADFDLALDCDPADASALLNRGYVRMTIGQRDPALADLRRAVEIRPEFAPQVQRIMSDPKLSGKRPSR
jgi:tetratricopeptide (TPR) repeat protein